MTLKTPDQITALHEQATDKLVEVFMRFYSQEKITEREYEIIKFWYNKTCAV